MIEFLANLGASVSEDPNARSFFWIMEEPACPTSLIK